MKKGKFSKIIVAFCIIQILVFTYICLWINFNDRAISDALIYGFFAVFGVELGGCAFIKHSKNKFTINGIEEKTSDEEGADSQ